MKTAKRAVLLVLCAMLLVIASVLGTMAYLTDTKSVTNTFTVGDVKIDLDEAIVDVYGVAAADGARTNLNDDDDTNDGNAYKLLPNHTYTKDPTVTVEAGSEESYVRMIVTIDKMDELDAIFPNGSMLDTFFLGYDATQWKFVGYVADETAQTRAYEFRYIGAFADENGIVDARESKLVLDALFDQIKVPAGITNEQLATLQDMTIDVVAQAIQADGFADATTAWNNFPAA